MTIAQQIKQLRKDNKISQQQMADKLNIHINTFNYMERKDKFSTKYLYKIFKILNADFIIAKEKIK